ncbi:MAG: ATP phosphoribosyltransferase regulatory subunit [Pseudomonadota bacterium]
MTNFNTSSARARIEDLLVARNAKLAAVDILQPAEPFLDTAGDEMRRRIFMARGVDGRNVCLRPEFTIPVCLAHLKNGKLPARHAYVGEVFRQGRAEGMEFLQAGIEDLGDTERTVADARIITDALALLDRLDAASPLQVTLGDQSVFDAVLRALELPSGWRVRLADAFGDADAMAAQLKALSTPAEMPTLPPQIAQTSQLDVDAITALVADEMQAAGLPQSGGRTARDIAKRLLGKIDAANLAVAPERVAQLEAFLSVDVPLSEAVAALDGFADAAGIDVSGAIAAFDARIDALRSLGLGLDTVSYAASFGRALDYYTGLVFEVRDAKGAVLVGGGRYDRLLEMLGAGELVPGVGFSIWLDRIGRGAS